MTRVFLADLHLERPDTAAFRTFNALLEIESRRAEAIYLLGDLCEVWVGDDDDGPLARGLRMALRRASRRSRVFLLHGNRDFLFGHQFALDCGITLRDEPWLLDDGTLLAHGDAFCIEDHAYQALRAEFRSASWQQAVLSRSLEERRALASNLREQSRRTNANKAQNIMDVTVAEVDRVARELGASALIHGHTHRPGRHRHAWGERYVLGAWERCGWLLRAPSGAPMQLECFALTGRYET